MRSIPSLMVFACLALAAPSAAHALPHPIPPDEVRFFAALAGTDKAGSLPAVVARVGQSFIGRPYLAGSLNDAEKAPETEGAEPLVCRLDAFDCVTFVESSLAIARAAAFGQPTYSGFKVELERLRYRHGIRGGYATRLHYFSEWIADNQARGILQDLTPSLGGSPDHRPIRFMSQHRASYRKLTDDRTFAEVQAVEARLATTPRYVLPNARVAAILPLLQSGDIIAFATDIDGLDVVHTGLLVRLPDGAVHLLHAPEPGEPVVRSKKTLLEYLEAFPHHVGVIIARPLMVKSGVN